MSQESVAVLAEVHAAKARADALGRELKAAKTALKDARERSVKLIRQGETSGDVIEDALVIGDRIGDKQVEEVLRSLHGRLLGAEGEMFMFGHHTWDEYDETTTDLREYAPSDFRVGIVPPGGLKFVFAYDMDYLTIPTEWNVRLQPRYFGGDGNYASWPFQDWNLTEFVGVPIGGWKKYQPVLFVGPAEIQWKYADYPALAELVLVLKNGRNGIKRNGVFEALRADTRSKPIIDALPLPALALA